MFADAIWTVPAWGDASLIELLWTATGLLTILVTGWALVQVLRAFAAVVRLSSEAEPAVEVRVLVLLAWGYVRRELLRVTTGLLILGVGVLASLTPSPGGRNFVTPTGLVLTAALFLIAFLTSAQSVLDAKQRRQAEKLLRVPPLH